MKTDEFFYENEAESLKADIEKAKSMTEEEMQSYFLKYNHYCISAYYITLGTNMTILYSKHSFIECFVCPINAK